MSRIGDRVMGISDVVSYSVWEHVRPVYDNSKHVALPRLCRIHDVDVIVAVKLQFETYLTMLKNWAGIQRSHYFYVAH